MARWAIPLFFGVLCTAGCKSEGGSTASGPAEGASDGPEQIGSFLDSPSGGPPTPLVPEFVTIDLATATDMTAAVQVAGKLFGAAAVARGTDSPPRPLPECRVRVGGPAALSREAVSALLKSGARGDLVFWYPLAIVRDRLGEGGTAGLWRGVLTVRDAVPGFGELGGTPVLRSFAVAARDARLVDEAVLRASDTPATPAAFFAGPGGTPVAYFGGDHGLNSPGFEARVERLNNVRNQGAAVWVLIALPLAQPHVLPRFQ